MIRLAPFLGATTFCHYPVFCFLLGCIRHLCFRCPLLCASKCCALSYPNKTNQSDFALQTNKRWRRTEISEEKKTHTQQRNDSKMYGTKSEALNNRGQKKHAENRQQKQWQKPKTRGQTDADFHSAKRCIKSDELSGVTVLRQKSVLEQQGSASQLLLFYLFLNSKSGNSSNKSLEKTCVMS